MESLIILIKEKLLYPFKNDFPFLLFLWIVLTSPFCYSQIKQGNYFYSAYIALLFYIVAYVIVFLVDSVKQISYVLKPLIFVAAAIFSILNLYSLHMYGCFFSNKLTLVVGETNMDEALEFFNTFITWKHWLLLFIFILCCIFFVFTLSKRKTPPIGRSWKMGGGLLLLAVISTCHNPGTVNEYLSNPDNWIPRLEGHIDLRQYPTHPHTSPTDSIHPSYVILIIGESFSRNHSSLYGYEKENNPLLKKMRETDHLIIFDHVTSPTTHTTTTFRYLLNTYLSGEGSKKKWYENTNVIETLKEAGYHTLWLSNQNEKGVYDNVPSGHAKLCDEFQFIQKDFDGNKHDGNLLNIPIEQIIPQFIIYHLMGQHVEFQSRYPANFSRFKATDYDHLPEHQREILAAYDNATLYNDHVVYSIIEKYKDEDAVAFYLSDHGIELFDTEPDYFGHAKATAASQAHCQEIPFMVYVSPTYQRLQPEMVERMKQSIHREWCADKLIYAIMDAARYKFADNHDVEELSLFKEKD